MDGPARTQSPSHCPINPLELRRAARNRLRQPLAGAMAPQTGAHCNTGRKRAYADQRIPTSPGARDAYKHDAGAGGPQEGGD